MSGNNFWLLKSSTEAARATSLRIAGNQSLLSPLSERDWVIKVSGGGDFIMAAHILRLRSDMTTSTLYFDRIHVFKSKINLTDLNLSHITDSIARLSPDSASAALLKDGISSLNDIPLIQDAAYVRDLLEMTARDDLLGPAGGPHEYIVDMSVRDRYLVGKLAPRRPDDQGMSLEIESATSIDDSDEGSENQIAPRGRDSAIIPELPRHEPGAEFNRATGRIQPDDDALDEIDTTNNQSLIPSSMGLTFCVAPDVRQIEVEARWGHYMRVPSEEHEYTKTTTNRKTGEEKEVKVKVWRRIPRGGKCVLPLEDGGIRPVQPDENEPSVRIQGTVRSNEQGERLVTIFLVNGQEEPEVNRDSAWLFQPEIYVRGSQDSRGQSIFRRRPKNDVVVEDPEQSHLQLIYRRRVEFAVGHGVAVHATISDNDPSVAVEIRTEVIPQHEVPTTETPGLDPQDRPAMKRMVEQGWLDMNLLAEMSKEDLKIALNTLISDYEAWINEQKARVGSEITGYDDAAKEALERCGTVVTRLREGMQVLLSDEQALSAFRFANRAMAQQRVRGIYALRRRRNENVDLKDLDIRKNRSWRPFQLAFLLLSIPALANPQHVDRTNSTDAFADLLWFPTGGGKTEAYLGVAAFAMAIRRLQGIVENLDGSRGLTVIMRYTLRLLTLQQFQRAATLLCSMETIRWENEPTWGREPFTLGLWVGNRVTPGSTQESHRAIQVIRDGNGSRSGLASPAQLTTCPWCGSEINPGRDIAVDNIAGRTLVYCGDRFAKCEFSATPSSKRSHPGLPVKVVDEEIYHRPPSMMISTVDKFAMMAWRPEVRTLFGQVREECERHGLLWPGHECGGGHQARHPHSRARVTPTRSIRPPDLIIQDEFHLISGPLGTMVGLYETAVDDLCSWRIGDKKIRPKIVASTATVRRAGDQIRNVFMRRLSIFPPKVLDVEDDFFSVQRPVSERPGRRYLGICAPGSSRPAVLIRTYTAFLTAAQYLFDTFGAVADPYMTLVGYFNSLRELGGMKRLAEDDVQTRSYRVQMSLVDRPGLAQRPVKEIRELTSRISNTEIPKNLDLLETTFDAAFDSAAGRSSQRKRPQGSPHPVDVVLATNMLSVGVDVNRLGLMVVNGQPKGTAEYIQATSRVGRVPPGLVVSVLTWARPRDLSHYETFEHYHSTFYQHVEAQSVTPFSPRALDRGLTGATISLLRNRFDSFGSNAGAGTMNTPSLKEMISAIKSVSDRAWEVTEDSTKKAHTEAELKSRADDWAREANVGGRNLVYQKRGPTDYPLLEEPGIKSWSKWTVPMSMREVEPGVRLVMEYDRTSQEPEWQIRPQRDSEDQV